MTLMKVTISQSCWKMNKANQDKFKGLCKANLTLNNNIDSVDYEVHLYESFNKEPTTVNLNNYKLYKPMACRAVKEAKKECQQAKLLLKQNQYGKS